MQPNKRYQSLMLEAGSSNWFVWGGGGSFVPILALRAYCFEIQALREFLVTTPALPKNPLTRITDQHVNVESDVMRVS